MIRIPASSNNKMLLSAATAASLLLPGVQAWGAMGHETVAYVATDFVAAGTCTYFQNLMADASANYLASVASWADPYGHTEAGKFSSGFHYIDAQDSPPSSCGVDFARDCGEGGCIVSAISNYTNRLLDADLDSSERQMAAKFVIHFLGDIGQPLHNENLEKGGNGIPVDYSGEETNLHHVWDSEIPESVSGGSSLTSARSWAANLTMAIKSGIYESQAAGWVSDLSLADAQNITLGWATESNAYVCSTVLEGGVSAVEDQDLGGDYTTRGQPVVSLQIAKQGYRLAKWLDAIASAV
ncbi:S1 p1 nuclease [Apiospora phragmitis]|uniref:S1 p1 nuclease n=1 Tax=Apiospora phragmitis TaxID=2905665 RepID=A0ABR1X617_9PEZI